MRFQNVTNIPFDAIEEAQTVPPGGAMVIAMSGAILFWGVIASYIF